MSKNPLLIPQPFAKNGNKNTIQNTRQAGQDAEDATWSDGFPNVTMQPIEAGGLPPKGMDFNGIFNALSAPIVHLQKGGQYYFDAAYAESIGGYEIGAVLMSDADNKLFISTIANNKNDPNKITAGWKILAGDGLVEAATANKAGILKVLNVLNSTDTLSALSAAQGKALNDNKLDKTATASSAKKLAKPVKILGIDFDGTTDIKLEKYDPAYPAWWMGISKYTQGFNGNRTVNLIGDVTATSAWNGTDALMIKTSINTNLLVPAGAISFFALQSPPTGWLKANGAAVSRTTYANLFAAIGTKFGAGDGATTFNLPDLRSIFIRAWDDGKGGIDKDRTFGSLQASENKSHTHSGTTAAAGAHTHTGATSTVGGSGNWDHTLKPVAGTGATSTVGGSGNSGFQMAKPVAGTGATSTVGGSGNSGFQMAKPVARTGATSTVERSGNSSFQVAKPIAGTGATSTVEGSGNSDFQVAKPITVTDNQFEFVDMGKDKDKDKDKYAEAAGEHMHAFITEAVGGSESRPENIALLACIKV